MADNCYTLLRLFEKRLGVNIRKEYVQSWQQSQTARFENEEHMYEGLRQDFLEKDMADTCMPAIPSDYGQTHLSVFPERSTVLQIVDVKDMSHSTHSLLNELATVTPVRQVYIRRAADQEVKFPRGMLRWTLTDGTHQIMGIEMKRINSLELKTPFGCKLLIKSCQVRRGMLLLDPSNITVLGGHVSALYGNSMLAELEKRFKRQLRIETDEPITTASDEPAATNNISPIPISNALSTHISPDTTPRDNPSIDDDEFGEDMDVDELDALEQTLTATMDATSDRLTRSNTQHPLSASASPLLPFASPTAAAIATTNVIATNAAVAMKNVPLTKTSQTTVGQLRKMIKCGGLDVDTVVVIVQVKRLFKFKVTTTRMHMQARIQDPSTLEDMIVIWPDEVLRKELGTTAENVIQMKEQYGERPVIESLLKPFKKRVQNARAEITLDLSILESYSGDEDMPDIPQVVAYKTLSQS